jgi:hypothetical protein
MIHVKPVVSPILFGQGGTMPAYESFVNSQIAMIKSERTIDTALASDTWRDHGRGNSPEATEAFKASLKVWRDGEVIRVSYTDVDQAVAVDGVRAVIGAYTKLYLESDTQSSQHQLKQLEALRDNYQQRLKGLDEQIEFITAGTGGDVVRSRYQHRLAAANEAEMVWRGAQGRLAEWLALHGAAAAAFAATGPADWTSGGEPQAVGSKDEAAVNELRVREAIAKEQFERLQADVKALGKQVAQVHAIEMDIDEIKGWRDTAKLKIEQMIVESAQTGRVSIPSIGDRPVLHQTAWWAILPAAFAVVYGTACVAVSAVAWVVRIAATIG